MSPLPTGARWVALAWLLPRVAIAAPLSADDVVRWTLDHHPEPIAAHGDAESARADRREAALFLSNPEIEASGSALRVSQALSPTGEGWSARREAALRAEGADQWADRVDLVVAASARDAWIDAATADRRASLADEALALAGRLRAATEGRAARGDASDLDIRLSRLEEAHALATAMDARADAARARVALAEFHPSGIDGELGDPLDGAPTSSGATPRDRADLAAARLRADAARAALARQRAAAVEPVAIGAAFTVGPDAAPTPYVAWGIPLFGRNQGAVARADAARAVAAADVDRVERLVTAEQATADRLVAAADADLGRLGDTDADARAALAAIESGVSSGALDLSTAVLLRADVLDGWTSALEVRAATAHARVAQLLAHDDPSLLGGAR